MMEYNYIYLMTLVTSYFADPGYSVLTDYYLWCVTNQSCGWDRELDYSLRKNASPEPEWCILKLEQLYSPL